MRALHQTLGGDLVHVRSEIVDNSFTNKSVNERLVTVKRRSDVEEEAKDTDLAGTRMNYTK
ncbi:unnamed protein product [Arabidopsis lyrata]|uniref:Predicted protein n=1 Tax=Arabidopsis lyrata subsp. lyrata TaxID=81972 RepID=D7M688_ARALL|nr:predicted protein [Arabidopsis lyrata subsp. lyrata]CAH8272468.1 unnamed protein product [Arabidopsis lyrata]